MVRTGNRGVLSILFCVMIVIGVMTFVTTFNSAAEDTETSGTCGKNVTWSFDGSSGVLEISGKGTMTDYVSEGLAPWYDLRDRITNVEIGPEVEGVTAGAFFGCDRIKNFSCEVSEDEDSSGSYATYGGVLFNEDMTVLICYPEGKQDVRYRVPDSVKMIEDNAFNDCENVSYISLPDGLIAIGNDAFANCSDLAKINIPDNVTEIGTGVFYGCENLKIASGGDSLDAVSADMFREAYGMAQTVIPENAEAIGEMAYARNFSLKKVTIPSSVTVIEKDAFSECRQLAEVYYEGSKADWESVSIGSGNGALKNADIYFDSDYPANLYESMFEDLDSSDWFFEAVTFALDRNIMIGTGDSVFSPNANLTRAALVQLLYNYEGQPAVSYGGNFSDVSSDAWYAAAVSWASSKGIVNGVSDNSFAPDNTLTREQFATILMRYSKVKSRDTSASGSISGFADSADVSSWALDAVRWAVGEGLISGFEDGTLRPGNSATRAQAATIIRKYLLNDPNASASDAGKTGDYEVSPIKGAVFFHPIVTLIEGQDIDSEYMASAGGVSFSTSDIDICEVDSSGNLTAVNPGYAVVTATYKGKDTCCLVRVRNASLQSITMNEAEAVKLGETKLLNLNINPSYANVEIEWSSSDTSVATVDEYGKITPVKTGKTEITADAGSMTAKCTVTVTYADVDAGSAFVDDINWAVSNDIIPTLSAVEFGPGKAVTKAEMAYYIWLLNGKPDMSSETNPFSDVSSTDPMYSAVMFAYKNGLASAKSQGIFGASDTCCRGDAIKMLWGCQKQRVTYSGGFSDVGTSSEYYYPARWAVATGVADGVFGSTVGQWNGVTKAEAARLLHRTSSIGAAKLDKSVWQIKYPKAELVLDKVGHSLSAAFYWSAAMKYYGHNANMPDTAAPGIRWYADYGFDNNKGNCYVMAATFYEMAVNLGYPARQMSGKVPLRAGGLGPHSWTEVVVNGTTYVCDPNFTNETGRNGYMINYGQSGTWRYQSYTAMSV